jgi:hypothetical protein
MWTQQWTFRLHKRRAVTWLSESQVGICSVERGGCTILIGCGSACSPEVLLYFKPNDRLPDEFFDPITETILYVLIPRTVLNGLVLQKVLILRLLLLHVLSLPKRCKSTEILNYVLCRIWNCEEILRKFQRCVCLWYAGRAIAQAVNRWLPTAAAQVQTRVWSSGVCGGQSGAGAGFLGVFQFPLPIFIPPNSPSS